MWKCLKTVLLFRQVFPRRHMQVWQGFRKAAQRG